MSDPAYETWLAHRELDRMPDPHRDPCEAIQAENERLREGIRRHREQVKERRFGFSEAADDDLWALLHDERMPVPCNGGGDA